VNVQDKFFSDQWSDTNGNPAGGVTCGKGFTISWQNGPLGRGVERKEPNGAFVETIIAAAKDRIDFYQRSRFACEENANAIKHLTAALDVLNARTKLREMKNIEGTHAV
jgi:hypothetical protein